MGNRVIFFLNGRCDPELAYASRQQDEGKKYSAMRKARGKRQEAKVD
ncbi:MULTISPECIES: hypothetical protein [Moorena]|uniref:Uncharacterized protein n=1 Tax=Moorena producens 3L TaxID=489825 RepID=F4Y136_9CYAN|nr:MULTISPECIES: hypothetical protein [Moorena]NEQ14633.1 hypothetical protein [Moorena sp. SIO3E2]AEE88210.1 hypothetical protein [Moorena producens 3L]EGJ29547.1 hypothetical protein LYNGBM3L_63310 [Moorena producens 3L]NEQ10790.1 hypothetical protein [Moorena sp. SIO4E2]NES41050.1 hypothetical protein [Moorena sp. SIO2C4]